MVSILPWIILFGPLTAAAAITLATRKHKILSATLTVGSFLIGFLSTLALAFLTWHLTEPVIVQISWIQFDTLSIQLGFLIDHLSLLMALVVTGVGSAIFTYSWGYMKDDACVSRFFASLALFGFSMLGIVFSPNFAQTFVFWELVGVSSYLLIGFWFTKPSAANASNKAFLMNRLADLGFILGILLLWQLSESFPGGRNVDFTAWSTYWPTVLQAQPSGFWLMNVSALLVFCGVMGKSAQFPMHIWLPDAMEGPTPVSALIHAATMVAAGIYLLCRTAFLYSLPESHVPMFLASLGALTAFLAGTMAFIQNDIKRILAYSTVSQLGFMVMAVGLGGFVPGFFHLMTHAFFKALLFLAAGSVIHATHTQDIQEMGGLFKKLPLTSWLFLIGALALAGVFPLAGFWSKDEILATAWEHSPVFFWIGLGLAGMTSVYITRLWCVAFLHRPHAHREAHGEHALHESPRVMTIPMMSLAVLSVIGGFFPVAHWLAPDVHHTFHMSIAISSSLVSLGGIGLGYMIFARSPQLHQRCAALFSGMTPIIEQRYYLDAIFYWFLTAIGDGLAAFSAWWEQYVIMGGLRVFAGIVHAFGTLLRFVQTGHVHTYLVAIYLGMVGLLCLWFKS